MASTRKADPTAPLVFPGCMLLASLIFSALIISSAAEAATGHAKKALYVREQMLDAFAAQLGVGGAIALAVVLCVGTGVWFGFAFRTYRRAASDPTLSKG